MGSWLLCSPNIIVVLLNPVGILFDTPSISGRPDLLDAALLRPGRLDRLLFCDFPSVEDRLDILTVLSRKLAAVQELLDSADSGNSDKSSVITNALLKSVASKARPSVSEFEKQRLCSIYSQFLDSKKSVAAQSRDAKGKRATLA
ncbi:hypothetical protein Dimus_029875 [Dionaea muscipula]